MSAQPNSAFPVQWMDFQPSTGEQIVREQEQGLTKREYFAIRILQAYAADDQQDLDDREKALCAVSMADELIIALKENPATPRS